jgi:hypothetical protein
LIGKTRISVTTVFWGALEKRDENFAKTSRVESELSLLIVSCRSLIMAENETAVVFVKVAIIDLEQDRKTEIQATNNSLK